MPMTVLELQNKLREFNSVARATSDSSQLQSAWHRLFSQRMTPDAASSFTRFYREMRKSHTVKHGQNHKKSTKGTRGAKGVRGAKGTRGSKGRTQHGGGNLGAPLDYTMAPGLPVVTFGEFPVNVTTDSRMIQDLDVFWKSGHGYAAPPAYFPTVSADMGSNKVQFGGVRSVKKTRRAQRGGSLMDSLAMRSIPAPFIATAPPNMLQTAASAWSGQPAAASSNPVDHSWSLRSDSAGGMINPAVVAPVNNPPGGLATSSLWGSTN